MDLVALDTPGEFKDYSWLRGDIMQMHLNGKDSGLTPNKKLCDAFSINCSSWGALHVDEYDAVHQEWRWWKNWAVQNRNLLLIQQNVQIKIQVSIYHDKGEKLRRSKQGGEKI